MIYQTRMTLMGRKVAITAELDIMLPGGEIELTDVQGVVDENNGTVYTFAVKQSELLLDKIHDHIVENEFESVRRAYMEHVDALCGEWTDARVQETLEASPVRHI